MARGRRRNVSAGWGEPPLWAIIFIIVCVVGIAILAPIALHRTRSPANATTAAPSTAAPPTIAPASPVVAAAGGSPVVAIFGDSYSTGYGATDPAAEGYVPRISATYGWQPNVFSLSGGGYIKEGTDHSGPYLAVVDRANFGALAPDAVVLQGGYNDVGTPALEMRGAAQEVMGAVRAAAPNAVIIVIGLLWPTLDVPRYVQADRDAIAEAAAAQPNTFYVDTTGLSYETIADNTHPTTDGYAVITSWVTRAIEAAGLATPVG